jgi:hypothetical protein
MLETSIIHSNLQSFYAQKPPVVFPDDSDDEGNEGACETDPGQAVAYMRAPPSRFVTKGETALTPVVFPEDSDDDEENVSALFTESPSYGNWETTPPPQLPRSGSRERLCVATRLYVDEPMYSEQPAYLSTGPRYQAERQC